MRRAETGVRESTGHHHTDDASLRTMRMSQLGRGRTTDRAPSPRRAGTARWRLVLDQANFTGAWPLGRFFDGEVDSLALPQ